ncbi:Serine/Threonine protein kinase [Orpheovirus IHUMI-LCC2]|uniref:Serine/Threonine protein kinase n=1 Tax=Orpheovirus IHUMI-LCC2 TaxID=2023057 RepID=A0A2I2L622_9VIRU|nr:Serine/Threonine protein kinase [Orpheovirus IHUMI-LCC2]SNW62984.1 Serine/Threonine protein kinase [Orpheovirus IHUMI-LCC2]
MEYNSEEYKKDNYKLEKILGRGAEGTTYRAIDLINNREVAIKIVNINSIPEMIGWKSIYEGEVYALSILSGDNICSKYAPCLYDYFITEEGFWIVMQLIQGEILDDIIIRFEDDLDNGISNIELRWIMIGKLLEAYSYINSKGIQHRDITQNNIIWNAENIVFIDFGFACNSLTDDCQKRKFGKYPDLKYLILVIDIIANDNIKSAYDWKELNFDKKYQRYVEFWDEDRATRLASITSDRSESSLDVIIQKYTGLIDN